ncbi:helix-turn-helix transcriptional regulator [Dietzia timorensis]|uniref:Helix-turn-helix domain-containing protein n=1 Tax=Dietzia timorensis TaxID=499555 RepID=A0A173LHB0_9ACTN|nr:helix-turn-helix domain-containing protein [Dietzia timorensis]ANI91263.1 Hypothetical protein BJL86_0456 [Dietzia timorensis]
MQRTLSEKIAEGAWLTSDEVGEYLGLSQGALRAWRANGQGPRFSRLTSKVIRYAAADVVEWARDPLNGPSASEPTDCAKRA